MTKKGLNVIKSFVETHGVDSVSYVVGSRDFNVINDYFFDIKNFCVNNGICWVDKENYNHLDFLDDYKFAVGWRWIIHHAKNLIVFHDSILPKYRGFSPLVNMLINGEELIGVSALLASDEYDAGDVLAQQSIHVDYPLKINDAINLISSLYVSIVMDVYSMIRREKICSRKQDHKDASYSLWLDDKDYFIDWSWSADKIVRFVNAVGFPYGGAKSRVDGKVFIFEHVELTADCHIEDRARHLGKVISKANNTLTVVCGVGLVNVIGLLDDVGVPVSLNFRTRFE